MKPSKRGSEAAAEGGDPRSQLMDTHEVAQYLKVKERKIYDLLRERRIPCTRVTGKWLFPRDLIDEWLRRNSDLPGDLGAFSGPVPPVISGSHDPLLDWCLREAHCGLAMMPGGSHDGLVKLAAGQAMAAGVHILDTETNEYNLPAVRRELAGEKVVALEWAWREQGLVVATGNPLGIRGVADLKAKRARVVARQAGSGSQTLFEHLLTVAGVTADQLNLLPAPARSETDIGLAVTEGRADAGLAIAAVARSLRLDFVPLQRERYDLVLRRRDYFEPPFQAFLAVTRSPAFAERAAALGGYDLSGLGTVHYNAP